MSADVGELLSALVAEHVATPELQRALVVALKRRAHELPTVEGRMRTMRASADAPLSDMLDEILAVVPLTSKGLQAAAASLAPLELHRKLIETREALWELPAPELIAAAHVVRKRLGNKELEESDLGILFECATLLLHNGSVGGRASKESLALAAYANALPAHRLDPIRERVRKSPLLMAIYRGRIGGL